MSREPAFFRDPKTHSQIQALARKRSLTIFAGAGTSLDQGSVAWDELVAQLLAQRLVKYGICTQLERALEAAHTLALSLGPVAAASAVRELYLRKRRRMHRKALIELIADDMHDFLYPKDRWSPGGALAEAIVRLAVMSKVSSPTYDITIITTNYDNNLEDYAGDEDAQKAAMAHGLAILPQIDNAPVPDDVIPVYHLNGYVPFGKKARGNLAFSEAGLILGNEKLRRPAPELEWREKLLEDRLNSSTTVFVGASLRDPTVIRSLVLTRGSRHLRYGVFPSQGDAWRNAQDSIRNAADAAMEARLRHLRVELIRPDYYGQVAQLLNEVLHCRVICHRDYTSDRVNDQRYSNRLSRWWSAWNHGVLKRKGHTDYQDEAQRRLADARDAAKAQLMPEGARRSRSRGVERLKVDLWIRADPGRKRQLELWANSESAARSDVRTQHARLEIASDYGSVQAFCKGFDTRGPLKLDQWKSHLSVLVILEEEPWYRLPVGVISLLSSWPEDSSCLKRLDEAAISKDVIEKLAKVGVALLDPDSDLWV